MTGKILSGLLLVLSFGAPSMTEAQHSVARKWNQVLIQAIREDLARPTVHARNLFHTAIVMYDAWAVYDDVAATYFLGKSVGGYTCPFNGISAPIDVQLARNEAISYAAHRLLTHRFRNSRKAVISLARFDSLLVALGYDTSFTSTDYSTGSPAALGNYIAHRMIDFGLQDGSNEQGRYAYIHYQPFNPVLDPFLPGNPDIIDWNRWQPLKVGTFIDQSGNIIPGTTPPFITPEWGQVIPFALTEADRKIYQRDGYDYLVYHDPGAPPYIDTTQVGGMSEEYKWSFKLVSIWSSHHNPTDTTRWDISPASIGNVQQLPQTVQEYRNFYNLLEGGDAGQGYTMNPPTGLPYKPQIVPRGDYTRVLTEFWADGLNSETPPGHWFTILNYVNDHPQFEKRFRGVGPILDDLEWDVKAYFILGGTMHDVAITAWGIKGWYDYVRPISAIRAMADRGQSSDSSLSRFHPAGMLLEKDFIEIVQEGDSLAGGNNENVGKIKIKAWRGHDYIPDPDIDFAGADWILAENWWPYQLKTFITPPFAGYISGHSTFSRAAAEIMTVLTGDAYFPSGLGEFHAEKNEYLEVEVGPSVDVTLQWATYRDASDQCSLSRIWGGIHPPIDDIPGRWIGQKISANAFALAERYFDGQITSVKQSPLTETVPRTPSIKVYPNPINSGKLLIVELNQAAPNIVVQLYNIQGQLVRTQTLQGTPNQKQITLNTNAMASGIYLLRITANTWKLSQRILVIN